MAWRPGPGEIAVVGPAAVCPDRGLIGPFVVVAGDPDIFIAVPMPMAGLPDEVFGRALRRRWNSFGLGCRGFLLRSDCHIGRRQAAARHGRLLSAGCEQK